MNTPIALRRFLVDAAGLIDFRASHPYTDCNYRLDTGGIFDIFSTDGVHGQYLPQPHGGRPAVA
jgi:hypothetical protein